jgi:hypothetical protein
VTGAAITEQAASASPDDRAAVDSGTGTPRPPAVAADGEVIPTAELESAAALTRISRQLGLLRRGFDGFRLYAGYVAYRRLRERVRRPG